MTSIHSLLHRVLDCWLAERSIMHVLALIFEYNLIVISSLFVKILSFGLYGLVDKFVLFQCIRVD